MTEEEREENVLLFLEMESVYIFAKLTVLGIEGETDCFTRDGSQMERVFVLESGREKKIETGRVRSERI